jgi:hypothetical protein
MGEENGEGRKSVQLQGNARKKGDKKIPRKMAAKEKENEAKMEGPSERESDILPLSILCECECE